MLELICHLLGDYVFQNHWMAANKVKRWFPALVHAFIYSIPFCLILGLSFPGWLVLFGTHAVIDRYRLASYWCRWYGIGQPAEMWGYIGRYLDKAVEQDQKNFADERFVPPTAILAALGHLLDAIRSMQPGYEKPQPTEPAPPFLAVWLTIIVDNTMHLVINHLALSL